MPCYIRIMNRIGMRLPQKIDEEKLEDILMKALKIPVKKHYLLRGKLNEMYAEDPEKVKQLLKDAVVLAGKKKKEKQEGPPDRLLEWRKQAKKVFAEAQ